jgi:excinuclease ABC subunit B
MEKAIGETNRRREIQKAFNEANGIVPTTIHKPITNGLLDLVGSSAEDGDDSGLRDLAKEAKSIPPEQLPALIEQLEIEMKAAAKQLEFERAARLRDQMMTLKQFIEQRAVS